MSRRNLFWPVAIICSFGVMTLLLISGITPAPSSLAAVACGEYPELSYPNCKLTQTAERGEELTTTATSLAGSATATTGSDNGGDTGGAAQPPGDTAIPTSTATVTATGTAGPSPATSSPTATRAPTSDANAPAELPSPTSVLPPNVTAIACVPGETIVLDGSATPSTSLLAFFDTRPVGGGFSRPDGSYRIRLLIGEERPGVYLVEVQERESRNVVQQIGCEVPSATPTPTPPLIP